MKKHILLSILFLVGCGCILFDSLGKDKRVAEKLETDNVKLFNGGREGSLTLFGKGDNVRSALDIGPTRGQIPNEHALSEVVLYRTQDQRTNWERMNWSAMTDRDPMYRFGVERGGTGQFRDIMFAYEDVAPGLAIEVLRIGISKVEINKPLHLKAPLGVPLNQSTPAAWMELHVNGESYFVPLYK